MKQPVSTPTPGRDNPARRAPRLRSRARHGDDQQPLSTVDLLDMDAIEAEQHIATETRTSRRARISAPRSRVKHVEVLGLIRLLALLILQGLDPYPPHLTRRASPHRMSEEPTNCGESS